MKKTNKLAWAVVSGLAVAGITGCASAPAGEAAVAPVEPVTVAETRVIRPLPSYGSMGGYRYRRFAITTL
ncbi:MAG TPA: hypothetical protein VKS43_00730 [Burkholderiales bacterium]|nr:hypothetical protein [Burkholderiales bacterium]